MWIYIKEEWNIKWGINQGQETEGECTPINLCAGSDVKAIQILRAEENMASPAVLADKIKVAEVQNRQKAAKKAIKRRKTSEPPQTEVRRRQLPVFFGQRNKFVAQYSD